ncbi:hypothetical protein B0A49_02399 [Cryomyces minteri]|uniref:CHAT domain-containing protein n=1 Tax=Cryomyces minteri TaxID=331657 RepID=A0A4U0XK95_9PEZI|nr:hypothetical protein B0A49_02399 [Cryomyces minteri]
MSSETLEIKILAVRAEPEHSRLQDSSSWLVTIDSGESGDLVPVVLHDPLDEEQRNECRWYIEEFVCKSPYSVTRARKAANALQQCASSLLDQLRLVERLKDASPGHSCHKIAISISEDGGAGNSIHQLYWELLEDPSPWNIDVDVTVKRIVISNSGFDRDSVQDLESQDGRTTAFPSVNGLLVVARDLSKDSKRYDDVSPNLALGVLARIQGDLQKTGNQAFLNLEVVRPGCLDALRKHLKHVSDTHGKGFYHFVHFDLHGVVQSAEGAAYLLFNDPDPDIDTTRRESAQVVAQLLAAHGIPAAVLNACESARANSGDAANIAKVFTSSGLRNVLAMSFRISSSAAELFLRAFYHSLMLDGNTYSQAASRAREILRRHPMRLARLGLQRSLVDNFVPVVYSNGSDLRFCHATPQSIKSSFDATRFALSTAQLSAKHEARLTGREFDLLRLEKQLLAQGKVHLTGRAGVGKTALLKHASVIWRQTSFVDLVLYTDFSKIYNLDEAIRSFTSQIPMAMVQRMALRAELRDTINSPEFNPDVFNAFVLDACAKPRLMIILDGLQAFYPKYLYAMPNRPSEESVPKMSRFMEALMNLGTAATPGHEIYHIAVSRLDTATLPFTEKMQQELVPHRFSLPSLRLSDSVQMAQLALRDAGLNIDEWEARELNELELLMGLLDGNPSAILQIVPQISHTGVPIGGFRALVQDGIVQKTFAGPGKDMVEEIEKLFRALADESRALLLLLSSFWIEGMGVDALLDWALSHDICKQRKSGLALSYILAQGLIDIWPGVQEQNEETSDIIITWIHPLITIYGRKIAHETLNAKQELGSLRRIPGASTAQNSLSYIFSSLKSPGPSQTAAAALVLSIIGVPFSQSFLRPEILAAQGEFVTKFLQDVAKYDLFRVATAMMGGIGYQELNSFWSSQSGNLRTCLSICIRKPHLPVDKWPLDYFEYHIANIRIVGSPVQVAEFADLFEQFFDIFINSNGSLAMPPGFQVFALITVTCLTAIYHCEVPVPTKREKFLQMALQIVAESEERFGPFEDPRVLYLKGLVLRYQVLYLLHCGKHEQAVNIWKQMLEIDKSIFEGNSDALGAQWSSENLEEFTSKMSASGADPEDILKRLTAFSSNTMIQAFYKSRKTSLRFIRAAAGVMEKGGDLSQSRQYRSVLAQVGDGMEQIHTGADTMGFKGINQDSRWWPEDFDMNRFAGKFDDPEAILAGLEDAVSSGDNAQATMHLASLFMEALAKLDMDEIEEYINALMKYSTKNSAPEADSINWESQKAMFALLKTTMGGLTSDSTDSQDVVADAVTKLIRLLEEQGASREAIEPLEISLDTWQKGGNPLENTDEGERIQAAEHIRTKIQNTAKLIIAKAKRDKNFLKMLPSIHLKYQQHMQQLQEAELQEDWDLALERLEALEDFCRQPENDILVNHSGCDWYQNTRVNYLSRRHSEQFVEQSSDALAKRDFEGAQRMIQTFENDLNPELQERASGPIAELKAQMELMPLEFAVWDIGRLRKSGKANEAIQAADDLIERVEHGSFEFLDAEQLRRYSYTARLQRTELNCLAALISESFEEASQLIEELRQLLASNPDLAPPDHKEKTQELEEGMLFGIHFKGSTAAARIWDVDEYTRHTKGFRALYEQQKRTPNMKRTSAPIRQIEQYIIQKESEKRIVAILEEAS